MRIIARFCLLTLALTVCFASAQQTQPDQAGRQHRGPGGRDFRGVVGQITEMSGSTLKLKLPDGSTGTVDVTSDTRFRKEQQDAKLSDFKVGDNVMVRGESTGENAWTARMIGSAPSQAQMQAMQQRMKDAMGKTMVVGEVKSIDAPKLAILRSDGVQQTIEADESTSFRRGREESITLPDIKVGDTVFARGELKNGTFVPTAINVVDPEMARRMKERGGMIGFGGGGDTRYGGTGKPSNPDQQQAPPQQSPK
jgi:hypothetical protein